MNGGRRGDTPDGGAITTDPTAVTEPGRAAYWVNPLKVTLVIPRS